MNWKTGDAVKITYKGDTVPGTIFLASPNAKSLGLCFDGVLGRYIGTMPVLLERGEYIDIVEFSPVKLEQL